MSGHHVKRRDQRFKTALEHEAAREQIAFACMTDAVPARPVFDEPRAYIDDSRWYTICPEPQRGDVDFDLRNPHPFYTMSSSGMESSTVYAARTDGSDPDLPEPRKPPDTAPPSSSLEDYGPIDSGCNLPVTNPATVAHFGLTTPAWEVPKWIKFGNGKRECSTHFAHFGPIIGQVAILDSAPDTLISVAVLCLKGLEVSFKIPGGPGIYLQGVLLHQGVVDPQSNMFYVNIRELLDMSLKASLPRSSAVQSRRLGCCSR